MPSIERLAWTAAVTSNHSPQHPPNRLTNPQGIRHHRQPGPHGWATWIEIGNPIVAEAVPPKLHHTIGRCSGLEVRPRPMCLLSYQE